MRKPYFLEFIIPTYKRPYSAIKAALSVLQQVKPNGLEKVVNVVLCDDFSPGLEAGFFRDALYRYINECTILRNESNKGMNANILNLVSTCSSSFCTILTDDDWIEPGALLEIVSELKHLTTAKAGYNQSSIGAVFTPRYSYLDDGSLHCIECAPFVVDTLIQPSQVNVFKYVRNSFILTGLILNPEFINFSSWRKNTENAFFPLLYYSSIALEHETLFLNRKWFHHTCLNVCHWEAWGATEQARSLRLHRDYLEALIQIKRAFKAPKSGSEKKSMLDVFNSILVEQLFSFKGSKVKQILIVLSLSRVSPRLLLAYSEYVKKIMWGKARMFGLKAMRGWAFPWDSQGKETYK